VATALLVQVVVVLALMTFVVVCINL
jgi:hypothetical protein